MWRCVRALLLIAFVLGFVLGLGPVACSEADSVPAAAPTKDAGVDSGGGCTPSCTDKLCGPDGCGQVCGICWGDDFCSTDGRTCTPHV